MTFEVQTADTTAVVDVSDRVRDEVDLQSGTCTVFVPHTTAGVTINEAESGLLADIEALLEELVPREEGYSHDRLDGNAHAHLRTMLLGSSVTVPVEHGELDLGTWQSLLLVESDGPRTRNVVVKTTES